MSVSGDIDKVTKSNEALSKQIAQMKVDFDLRLQSLEAIKVTEEC